MNKDFPLKLLTDFSKTKGNRNAFLIYLFLGLLSNLSIHFHKFPLAFAFPGFHLQKLNEFYMFMKYNL